MLFRHVRWALLYPILALLLLPFVDAWKWSFLFLLSIAHIFIRSRWEEKGNLEKEKPYLPLNLLLFSFLCRMGLPLPRVLQFMDKNSEKGILWKTTHRLLCYIFRGHTLDYAIRELDGVEKEIGGLLLDVWLMSKTEHPYSILRTSSKGFKGRLIEKVEVYESKKAVSKALSFFLPMLITPLVSPHFLFGDFFFTIILAFLLYKVTFYIMG